MDKRKQDDFINKSLLAEAKTASFWNTESWDQMADIFRCEQTIQFRLDKAVKVTVDSEVQFRRLFDVSNQRDVNLQKMMAHEL